MSRWKVDEVTRPGSPADSLPGEVQGASFGSWLFAPGQLLAGRYRVRWFVARGGSSEVYEAQDERLGVTIAVKALLPGGDLAGCEQRVAREVVLARQIAHPGVCRVFDVGQERASGSNVEVPFVTMEMLRGQTLAHHLASSGPLPLERVTMILEQLAGALDAAHAAGVVHRDLKPGNVILVEGRAPRVVITDFGLARALSPYARSAMATRLAGTPAYMAPEQLLEQPATAATDIYALGLTLFEMVTGTRPFGTSLGAAVARLRFSAPLASTRRPDLDARWDAAIARCLAREPADRFVHARHVVRALRAPVPRARLRAPRAWLASLRRALTPAWQTLRKRRARAIGSSIALLVAGALTGAAVTSPDPAAPAAVHGGPPGDVTSVADSALRMRAELGSAHDVELNGVAVGPDGDIFVVGHGGGPIRLDGKSLDLPAGSRRGFVLKLGRDRRVKWIRSTGGPGESSAQRVGVTGDHVIVAGTRNDHEGCFVAALATSDGRARWLDACDREPTSETALAVDADGVYVASSRTRGSVALTAYQRDGRKRWRLESRGGQLRGPRLSVRGSMLAFGGSYLGPLGLSGHSLHSRGAHDLVIGAFDTMSGDVRWLISHGGFQDDTMVGVVAQPEGGVMVVGHYRSKFGPLDGGRPPQLVASRVRDPNGNRHFVIGTVDGAWAPLGTDGDQFLIAGVSAEALDLPYHTARGPDPRPGLLTIRGPVGDDFQHVAFGDGANVALRGIARSGDQLLVVGSFSRPPDHETRTGVLMWVDGPWEGR